MRLIILLLVLLYTDNIWGQSDSTKSEYKSNEPISDSCGTMMKKCFDFAYSNKLDSGLYYANKLEAILIKELGEISERRACCLYFIGELYVTKNDYLSAQKYLKQSYKIFLKIPTLVVSNDVFLLTVFRLGIGYEELGDLYNAQKNLLVAAELNQKKGKERDFAQSMLNLANIYLYKGDFIRADSLFTKANSILDTLPKDAFLHYLQGSIYNNLAMIDNQTGNLSKAIVNVRKALDLQTMARKEGYRTDDYLRILLNEAESFTLVNQIDSALAKCKQVEDSIGNDKGSSIYANVLVEKAIIYQQQSNFKQALNLFKYYIKIVDSLPVKPDNYLLNLVNLGVVYTNIKKYKAADSLFRDLIKTLTQSGLQYSYAMLHASAGLCSNLIDQQKYNEASDSILDLIQFSFKAMENNFAGMSEAEQLQYRKDLDKVFDLLYMCIYKNKTPKHDIIPTAFKLELERKNLILNNERNMLKRVKNSNDSNLTALYYTWLSNKQMLANQYSLAKVQRFLNIDSLEELTETLERKLNLIGFVPFIKSSNLNFSTVNPNTTFIQFVRFEYNSPEKKANSILYAAFIANTTNRLAFISLCNEKALLKIMKNSKGDWIDGAILAGKLYENSKEANDLYRLIWQPMLPYLNATSNINYTTEGLLNNIAFNAIFDGKKYLMNKYRLYRFSSLLETTAENRLHQMPQFMNIWGNMDYSESVYLNDNVNLYNNSDGSKTRTSSLLPIEIKTPAQAKSISKSPLQSFRTSEVSDIKELFASHKINCTNYEGVDATEENFKRQATNAKGILHISTHGFYTPANKTKEKALLPGDFIAGIINPLFRCGLAFSGVNYYWMRGVAKDNHEDGILTGYEITQLDLSNVVLVSLSACETALGDIADNEGSIGLQRAFKIAGVQRMIVSLWEVPAKQTSELFGLFYSNWLNDKALSDALQKAQETMQKKGYPPYYWAGFVLIE